MSGVNACIDCVDIVEHFVGTPAAHQLHGGLARKTRQGLGAIPGIGHQRGTKARFDLVEDFDQLPKPTLGPVGAHPFLALHGVATKSRGASDFLARRPQRLRDLARATCSPGTPTISAS
jgi:hypothetical protein